MVHAQSLDPISEEDVDAPFLASNINPADKNLLQTLLEAYEIGGWRQIDFYHNL